MSTGKATPGGYRTEMRTLGLRIFQMGTLEKV